VKVLHKYSNEDLISLRMRVDAEMAVRGLEFSVGLVGEKAAIDFLLQKQVCPTSLKLQKEQKM